MLGFGSLFIIGVHPFRFGVAIPFHGTVLLRGRDHENFDLPSSACSFALAFAFCFWKLGCQTREEKALGGRWAEFYSPSSAVRAW
jgi:hypothetical protein